MAKQLFKQAPLPFVGQKRQFLTHVSQIINDNIPNDGKGWTIIDVFGGSGLLAHTAKHLKPQARAIYNDFDGYTERLNHIDDTNRLRQQLYAIIGENTPRNKRLDADKTAQIIQTIQQVDGYIDINCVASWLLFSGQQVRSLDELFNKIFWNGIRQTDYPSAVGYLDNLEITHESFHTLLPRFQKQDKVLLLLDPPYLCTKQESYKQENYFDLIDFLRLIHLTKPPYIFFSSTKSEFVRFIEAMVADKWQNWQAFEGAERISVNASLNYQTRYEDNLVYKF
ncbi:DNA adenine methylase [Seminibacterium arietis]|uniref:DNA adenine methylase n=1 Tax=Seminibacterium arietis TaxID=1173502 RepID=A0ABW3IB29_9PAST